MLCLLSVEQSLLLSFGGGSEPVFYAEYNESDFILSTRGIILSSAKSRSQSRKSLILQ